VPNSSTQVTAFIDVQGQLLYYMVCAWDQEFGGAVIDYGSYPDQKRSYFTLREARPTLADVAPGAGLEGSIFAGLDKLTNDLLSFEWQREGSGVFRIGLCLVHASWGNSTDTIYEFCQRSVFGGTLMPSHGKYVEAASTPFAEYQKQLGDRVGHNWRIPSTTGKRAIRHVVYDTNYWKSFIFARLAVALGDKTCLSLFGTQPESHRLLADL
jgi:hypothetical protein